MTSNTMYEMHLMSEEQLLQCIKDNIRNWATEEYINDPDVPFEDHVENNISSLSNIIRDFAGPKKKNG